MQKAGLQLFGIHSENQFLKRRKEMNDNKAWTIAYRKRTANRFERVTDWSGTWEEAIDMAAHFGEVHPELQVFYVPTSESEQDGNTPAEDIGNVLVDSGKRVRITETGTIGELGTADAAETDTEASAVASPGPVVQWIADARRYIATRNDYLAVSKRLGATKYDDPALTEDQQAELKRAVGATYIRAWMIGLWTPTRTVAQAPTDAAETELATVATSENDDQQRNNEVFASEGLCTEDCNPYRCRRGHVDQWECCDRCRDALTVLDWIAAGRKYFAAYNVYLTLTRWSNGRTPVERAAIQDLINAASAALRRVEAIAEVLRKRQRVEAVGEAVAEVLRNRADTVTDTDQWATADAAPTQTPTPLPQRCLPVIGAVVVALLAFSVMTFAPTMAHAATATQTAEQCAYSDSAEEWLYGDDGGLCEGTGEDPTTDSNGNPVCANGVVPWIAWNQATASFRVDCTEKG